jgi:PilZ domain
MSSTRKFPRQTYNSSTDIPVTVIQFGKLERMDITVKGVDISDGGLGIQTDIPLSPGFVWFWSTVGTHKGGMIVWSRKEDSGYRAGIQFLPIPMSPRDYLQVADD